MAKQGRRRGRGRPMGHRRPGARGSGPIRIEDLGAGERGKRQGLDVVRRVRDQNNIRTSSHPHFSLYNTYALSLVHNPLLLSLPPSQFFCGPQQNRNFSLHAHTDHDRPPERIYQPGCRGAPASQGRRYPRDGDVLPSACTCFLARNDSESVS